MRQTLINVYVIISAVVAIVTTILEVQPALYFINFLAANPGEKYSFTFVLLITFLLFLIPLLFFVLVLRFVGRTSTEEVQADRTGFFITRQKSLSSALVGIPVYVNGDRVGLVDNGKTVFFDLAVGTFTIQAGKGKRASEEIKVSFSEKDQLKFDLSINTDGLVAKVELVQGD